MASGRLIRTLDHKDSVRAVTYSGDGRWLATASRDRTAKLWDAHSGKTVHTLTEHTQAATCVAFSPDSRLLATGDADKAIRIWEVASGRMLRTWSGHSAEVTRLAFSPDGRHLVSAGKDKTVRLWDPDTGREVVALDGHADPVTCLAISRDGRHLASASGKLILLWDLAAILQSVSASGGGESPPVAPRALNGHADLVNDLAFTPEGDRLASTSDDWTVKLWDVETGSQALTLESFSQMAFGVAFSPDGQLLAVGSNSKNILIWEAPDSTSAAKAARREAAELRAWDWHQSEATACERSGAAFGALFHLNRLLEARPGQGRFHDHRGRAYAQLGEWDRAAADFATAVELGTGDSWAWYLLACVSLQRGDSPAYRRVCAQMLERFGATQDPAMANSVAWLCQLTPDAVPDPDLPVQLALRAVTARLHDRYSRNTLGAALYRAGRFAEAVRQLDYSVWLHRQGGVAQDWLFLAMAHHHLGQAAEARRWLDQAVRWLDAASATASPNGSGRVLPWHDAIEFRLLRGEAEALLNGPNH